MHECGSLRPGMLLAGFAAGPAFQIFGKLAQLYLTLPVPVVIEPIDLLYFMLLLLPAVPLGFIPAGVPILLGAVAMRGLADLNDALRPPFAWTAGGAAIGFGMAALFGILESPNGFALVATSAVCARLCRTSLHWEPEPRRETGGYAVNIGRNAL